MYRLFQFTLLDGTESQSIYEHDTETSALASFHSKYGSQIKSPYYDAQVLIVCDGSLNTIVKSYHTQDDTNVISPRLLEVKTTTEESANASKYDSEELVIGNYHSKLGSAMSNEEVKIEVLKGIDGQGNEIIHTSWIRPVEETTDTTEE